MNINYNLLIMFHLEEACQEQFISTTMGFW